ncbi:hypothetical protein HMPREF9713_02463 [Myroides odoratimimus CCUG 12700]|uniref:SH3 domain-containing protein n=1 Tax=Myroides odoratimimus TaxID=76832 RepID=UPI000353E34D|nr:SH3 domain-containing protein [Myroides odoratimimus]EPH10651.1 hypothetical protein HMPREF9713_02463 [Myroides odoratimimus CCUG 12700]
MKKTLYLLLIPLFLIGCKDKENTTDNNRPTYTSPPPTVEERPTTIVTTTNTKEVEPQKRELDIHHSTEENYFDKYDICPEFIIEDETNMRSCPSLDCDIVGTLKLGEEVKILERSENAEELSGIFSNWYKVTTNNKTGWVFGSKIANFAYKSHLDDGVLFIGGLKSLDNDNVATYQIKAVLKNSLVASKELVGREYKYIRTTNLGSMGLNVDDIIKINIPCNEGCGCDTGDIYIFWNDYQFSQPYEAMGVADTWASEGIIYTFPRELSGLPNTVIKEEVKFVDGDENKVKRTRLTEYLIWDGTKLVPHPNRETKSITYWTNP